MKRPICYLFMLALAGCASAPQEGPGRGDDMRRGKAVTSVSESKSVDQLVIEGMTLHGAALAYATTSGNRLRSLEHLVPAYMTSVPFGWSVGGEGLVYALPAATARATCAEIARIRWAPGVLTRCTVMDESLRGGPAGELLIRFGGLGE